MATKTKTLTAVKLADMRVVTPDFTPNNWETGDVLTAEKLNNTDTGVQNAIQGVKALEGATATATALSAGQQPTVSWDGAAWTFGIPAGAKGDTGEQGPQGEQGPKGDQGDQGPQGPAGNDGAQGERGPAGEQGPAGERGPQGEQGPAGQNGVNGASIRVSATALSASQAGIAADTLTPNNATIPYKVGDIVLDATNKTLYSITEVSGGTATIGTALAVLP